MAVDQSFLRSLSKEAVKRQEVIYGESLLSSPSLRPCALLARLQTRLRLPEFIQTEMHHVRTLKVLLQVYMYELRRSQLMEDAKLERLFLSVEELLGLHQHFLGRLKARQKDVQTEERPDGYQIAQFGDILLSQVGERIQISSSL